MTAGLELVQWALWWMAEQRRQYILKMRKALYYTQRIFFLNRVHPAHLEDYPLFPGYFTFRDLTNKWQWEREVWQHRFFASDRPEGIFFGPGY